MKLFTFCFIFISYCSFAQNATLSGKVSAQDSGEEMSFIGITVENNGGVRSDFDGSYKLNLPAGTHHLIIKQIGYKTIDTNIVLKDGEIKVINFLMAKTNLETVVVAAGKYEQKIEDVSISMNIIKPALVENKATIDCESVIEQVPGLTSQDGQVSIRGGAGFAYGAGSRVLVLVDELPYLSADAGDVKWNALPIENIEQIEIMKGASSVLYGSSALNGVINIRTKYPRAKPETRINLHHGIYGDPKRNELKWWDSNPYYYGGNFYHMRQIKNFDLVVGGNFLSAIGYRQGEDEDRIRFNANTRYRSKKIDGLSYGLNTNIQLAKTAAFVLWESDSAGYLPAGGSDPNSGTSTLTFQDGWRVNFDPYIEYFDKKGDRHSLRTRWFRTNNVNNQGRGSLADLMYGEYQYQKYYDSLAMNVTLGVSGYTNTVRSDFYGDHGGTNVALFGQVDKKWKKFNFNAGLRFEYFKLDTTQSIYEIGSSQLPVRPVLRAGTTYKLFEYTVMRASWGQGFRFPTIAEKYASTNIGTVSVFPNAELEPESGWSSEIGVKQIVKIGKKWLAYLDVAAFWTEYQNMIEFTFDEFFPPNTVLQIDDPNAPNYLYNLIGFQARNAENARITGIDFSIAGQGEIYKDLGMSIFAGYTYMNPITLNTDSAYLSTSSDPKSNILKYRYRHLIKGDIQFDYKKWSIGCSGRYNSFMQNIDQTFLDLVIDFDGTFIHFGDQVLPGLPDYRERNNKGDLVFDFRTSYELNENSKLAFLMNNMLNNEYAGRPGNIREPRTFIVQATLNF